MKVVVFLLATVFALVCAAWLFTSEHSPLVSALGIGAEGDFAREAQAQIPSLIQIREAAACAELKRQNRREWEGRFQHSSVKLMQQNPEFDAEGIVRYYAIDPRNGGSHDCEDRFRRNRNNSKWQLITDPAGNERGRISGQTVGITNDTSPPDATHEVQINAASEIDVGLSYFNGTHGYQRDFAKAMAAFKKAADSGNARAMTYLAGMYEDGEGVSRDYWQAIAWYKKAADLGDTLAMNNIGTLYGHGDGVAQDYQQAMTWYRKAADRGEAIAMTNIGDCYRTGDGVGIDYQQAVSWYKKGAGAGDPAAMNKLGAMYANGLGIEKDYEQAIVWYRKGADAGDRTAMENIGGLYDRGEGVNQSDEEAMKWYHKAAEAGDTHAMTKLGSFYAAGRGVVQDRGQAIFYFRKAASLGDDEATKLLLQMGMK